MPKKNGKKTKAEQKEEKARKKANRNADELLKEMEELRKEIRNFVDRQDEGLAFLDGILPGYEERLKNEKMLYDENKLSSEMIEGDPVLKWTERYTEFCHLINQTYDQGVKYQELVKKFQDILKNKNLDKDKRLVLETEEDELYVLWDRMYKQNPLIVENSCRLRFDSLVELLYKSNTQARELIKPLGQMIDQTEQCIYGLKNLLSQLSAKDVGTLTGNSTCTVLETASRLKEEIDKQIRRNEQYIERLDEKILENRRDRFFFDSASITPCYQMKYIRDGMGDDYLPLKKLREKETEFNKQIDDFENNTIALTDAKTKLISLNKELLAQKTLLSKAERKLKGTPELSLHPNKKQYVFPTQKKLNLTKQKDSREEKFRLALHSKEDSKGESVVFPARKKLHLKNIAVENPTVKIFDLKPKSAVQIKERAKSQNNKPIVRNEQMTATQSRHNALSVERPCCIRMARLKKK